MSNPILAAHAWPSNAELIEACHNLGYIKDSDKVLDPTFGRGTFWKAWQPKNLTALNRDIDGTDFRKLGYPDKHFDVAVYDPPYCATGGRATTTIPDFYDAYGMMDAPRTPELVQEQINDGLTEMNRIADIVLVKCQGYISSGKYFPGQIYTANHALGLGMEILDQAILITSPRPQPAGRRQVHFRNNYSNLYILKAAQ